MDRQYLIDQVKDEYSRLADLEGLGDNSGQQLTAPTPESYYENLLGQVIKGIEAGSFDEFATGREIVEAVANNKDRWGITI